MPEVTMESKELIDDHDAIAKRRMILDTLCQIADLFTAYDGDCMRAMEAARDAGQFERILDESSAVFEKIRVEYENATKALEPVS
ncbi:MAG: hypothetical protein ACREQI_01010 [Candidatus Binataceae bacterium]